LTLNGELALGQDHDSLQKDDTLNELILSDGSISSDVQTETTENNLEATEQPDIQINNNIPGADWLVAIIPILTLLLGFVLNKAYERWLNREKTKKSGKEWIENMILLKEPLSSQITFLEEFIEENPVDQFTTTDLKYESDLEGEAFKSLNKENLIPYLNLRNKEASYRDNVVLAGKISRIIKSTEHSAKGIVRAYSDLKKNFGEHMVSYNEEFQKFMEKFRIYGVQLERVIGGDPVQHEPYRVMLELVSNHIGPVMETGEADLFGLVDSFFMPFAQATTPERQNPIVIEMTNHLSNCMQQIKGMKQEKKVVKELTQKHISSLKKSEEALEKVLVELKVDDVQK
jgi:hypothetical protein